MFRKIILILLIPVFLGFGEDTDSTKTSFKNLRNRGTKSSNYKGIAPILSAFIPGGGHFYLGDYKTGIAYGSTRLLLIPGLKLWLDNHSILGQSKNKTKEYFGLTLCAIGCISWTVDIIHAGISAKNYQPIIHEDKKGKLSYNIIPNFEKQKVELNLNYTFK